MILFFIKQFMEIVTFVIMIEILCWIIWYKLNSDSSFEIINIKVIKKTLYYLFFKYFPIIFIINLILYLHFGESFLN
jgi:hypothetical protein